MENNGKRVAYFSMEFGISPTLKIHSGGLGDLAGAPKKEAPGTSGRTATMNRTINLSTNDGWIPEFAHGHDTFGIPEADTARIEAEQDEHEHLMRILTTEIIPSYSDRPDDWLAISKTSMREVALKFESHRMADEYYKRLYS